MSAVAVLFARSDSVYFSLPDVDVWDIMRDARKWRGGCPVVAHPPCRAWGRLRAFSRHSPDEMELARLAVELVRRWGGCLEHPQGSTLWRDQALPLPWKGRDSFGGWTLPIHQWQWGHRAEKATWLYIVGCDSSALPPLPDLVIGDPTHVVQTRKRQGHRPDITKPEREHTPPALASWLVELARRCDTRRAEALREVTL